MPGVTVVGIVSTGLVDETEVLVYTGIVGNSDVVDVKGTSPVEVEDIELLSGVGVELGAVVGPAGVVLFADGYGYGFVSWEVVSGGVDMTGVDSTGGLVTGVEVGTGGLDEGPQLKPMLWMPTSHFSFLSVSGSLTVTDLASPHW